MKRLHGALAIVAALLAAAAGAVDRGPIGQHRRNSIQTPEFISAPELAGRVIRGDRNLRVFDLRSQSAFEQFHVPGARPLSPDALVDEPLTPSISIVLYGDGRATLADALRVLRVRNHTDVRILREGTFEWIGRVHEPRLAVDATPEERAEFERAAEMSRFFGGVPRAGVPREEVPQGYWTGKARTDELLAAAALQAVTAIRRRGC